MSTLRVRGWDRWQSYRKDRGQPPWIKVHRALMRNWEWIELTDAERGQLVAIWLLAADHDGVIMASPRRLKVVMHMTKEPDLERFIELGFLEQVFTDDDANVTPTRRQGDAPETETETENKHIRQNGVPYQGIVDLYHQMLPTLPRCVSLTPARRGQLSQRHKDECDGSLENWASLFRVVSRSRFLMGKEPPGPGRAKPFIATLDWITKQDNFVKIIEGKYHDKR